MTQTNLNYADHTFVKKLVEDKAWFHQHQTENREKINYCDQVYSALGRVKQILLNLQIPRVLLAEQHASTDESYTSTLSKASIRRYHIENYFLRLTTYKDLIIHLIAAVHEWPLPNHIGAERNLIRQADAAGNADITNILTSLDQLLSTARPIRNNIAHQGATKDVNLLLPELYREVLAMAKTLPEGFDTSQLDLPDDEMVQTYEFLTTEKSIYEMLDNEQKIATNLFKILDLLLPVYLLKIPETHSLN